MTRRASAWGTVAAVAFTVYGSLVPFEFRPRTWSSAVEAFPHAMTARAWPESRSDGLANVLLGVPLGFFLVGLVRGESTSRPKAAMAGVAVLPGCAAFAAGIEFVQLFTVSRTCAGSDVLAQTLGSALGMTAWVVAGPRLMAEGRKVLAGGAAVGLLIGYLVLLGFVQALPLDLTASPADLYRKVRDGGVTFVPFGEWGRDFDPWVLVGKWLRVFALYVPAGWLFAHLNRRRRPHESWRIVLAALLLAAGMEAVQLIVKSRTPGATDVVVGAAGALTGWAAGRKVGWSAEERLLFAQAWLVLLLVAGWTPFDFRLPPRAFDWVPGLPLETGEPLFALEEVITKLILFAPLGAVAGRRWVGVTAGAAVAAAVEVGQLFLASHLSCVTDVLIGAAGGYAGWWVRDKVRGGGSDE